MHKLKKAKDLFNLKSFIPIDSSVLVSCKQSLMLHLPVKVLVVQRLFEDIFIPFVTCIKVLIREGLVIMF